jgi:hypothetical protein
MVARAAAAELDVEARRHLEAERRRHLELATDPHLGDEQRRWHQMEADRIQRRLVGQLGVIML